MAQIATVDRIAEKWARVTPTRVEDYRLGVQAPVRDWQEATLASNDAWKGGVQQAVAQDLFQKGVRATTTQFWQQGSLQKGVDRWPQGVQLAIDLYQRGFAPFREAISRVQLPPRRARRDPANLERSRAIVNALIAAKRAV